LDLMTLSVSSSIIFQLMAGTPSVFNRYGSRRRYRVVRRAFMGPLFSVPFLSGRRRHSLDCSEMTPKGRKSTKLAQTLLNGNNICMVCVSLVAHSGPMVLTNHFHFYPAGARK
jgi:hypothetical protein